MTRDDGYFQDYIENLFQQKGYPGMAISIRGPEGILFERGFGYRDIENEKPADQDTMFGIASMSKSLTALACCLLHIEESWICQIRFVSIFPRCTFLKSQTNV